MKKKKFNIKLIYISIVTIILLIPFRAHAILSFSDIGDAISGSVRRTFISIDKAIYGFVGQIYELFFDISRLNFLAGDVYSTIFKRVFLILGIFMLFKLTFSLLRYLISPDALNDKEKGAGKLIGRVITCVLILIVLVPFGSTDAKDPGESASSKLNANIRNQGIAFGTLQTMQELIVEKNLIGKIVLGSAAVQYEKNTDMGENIALTVFSAFFRRNQDVTVEECEYAISDNNVTVYKFDDSSKKEEFVVSSMNQAYELADVVCDDAKNSYLFTYDVFISTIVGLVVVVLIFLFTFDVAIRGIKLGILRLIAPIPAISYIDPKSSKDGAFANYIKTLMSTYLDLFLRLAIIYVVILLISAIAGDNTTVISGTTNTVGKVIIIIALLFFAGQAPKFIMQALGIKSNGTGLGFGAALLGGALAGGFAGATTGGVAGAVKGFLGGAAAGSQNQWAAQNGQRPNMSARQAALNRGAQLGSGDPNAKGEGLIGNMFGRIGNQMMGINKGSTETAKGRMYKLQNLARTASSDFTTNTGRLYGTDSNGNSWKDIATDLNSNVLNAQSNVTAAQNQRDLLYNAYQRGDAGIDENALMAADEALTLAKSDLVTAQEAQQEGMSQYSDYINTQAGKAQSDYEKANKRYQKHGRSSDGLKAVGKDAYRKRIKK
ncbi:MAG: conjugal transfer protein TrbL family protein [Bacilli bacterium]